MVHMKKSLSLLLTILLCFGLTPQAHANNQPFDDVSPAFWAYDEIMEAYSDGAITGMGDRTFRPNDKLTMAQFLSLLINAFYRDDVEASDAANTYYGDAWFMKYYAIADKHRLLDTVKGEGRTEPATEITRETMAHVIYNLLVDQSVQLPEYIDVITMKSSIPDFGLVRAASGDAVATCYRLGLITGMDAQGTFAPAGKTNRAQAAVIYVRLKNELTEAEQKPAELTNGQPVTEENVLALMHEYHDGKAPAWEKAEQAGFTSYMDGAKYDAYDPVYSLKCLGRNGVECAKFAFAFWDELFGDLPAREVENLEDIRPGDLLQYTGHWAIATSSTKSEDGLLWITEVGGGSSGEIGWGWDHGNTQGVINNDPADAWRYTRAYTRYPD